MMFASWFTKHTVRVQLDTPAHHVCVRLCLQFNPTLNPWKSKAVLQYMQAYYAAALQWLKSGATDGKWKVKGVFAWNLVSWDIQGVHPLSYAGDGGTFKGEDLQAC